MARPVSESDCNVNVVHSVFEHAFECSQINSHVAHLSWPWHWLSLSLLRVAVVWQITSNNSDYIAISYTVYMPLLLWHGSVMTSGQVWSSLPVWVHQTVLNQAGIPSPSPAADPPPPERSDWYMSQ